MIDTRMANQNGRILSRNRGSAYTKTTSDFVTRLTSLSCILVNESYEGEKRTSVARDFAMSSVHKRKHSFFIRGRIFAGERSS